MELPHVRSKPAFALLLIVALAATLVVQLPGSGSAQQPDAQTWQHMNRDLGNTRANLDSGINTGNVGDLGIAWTFDIPAAAPFGGAATSPIVVDGMVYLHDLESDVHALDLETGEVLWSTDYGNETVGPNGVAFDNGRVFALSAPDTLVALDAENGQELWSVSFENQANIQPIAHNGVVHFGTTAGANESYAAGVSGIIYALDQENGEILWQFQVVEEGFWGNPEVNSGGGLWYPPAVDEERGLAYWGTGNPAPFPGTVDFPNGTSRPGPNLYTNSIVALSIEDGSLEWFNQVNPHDLFDLDLQLPPILAEVQDVGQMIIASGKIGIVYGIDPESQEVVWQQIVGTHQNDIFPALPVGEEFEIMPGIHGGVETPMAYAGNMVYVPVLNRWTVYTATGHEAADATEALSNAAANSQPLDEATGQIVAIDARDGRVAWARNFDSPNYGGATVAGDVVFTATFDGMMYGFNRETGEEVFRYQADGGINAWPAVAGDTILLPVGLADPPQLVALRVGAGEPVASPSPTQGPGQTTTPSGSPSPAPTPSPTEGDGDQAGEVTREVSAEGIQFNVDTITVPAGAHVVMPFTNNDAVPHNVAVYQTDAAEEPIFVGEVFSGPDAMRTYEFDAPSEPGEYFFRCDTHPVEMRGSFIVE